MQHATTFNLDEAAVYLTRATRAPWSARDVLRAAADDKLRIFARADRDAEAIARDERGRFRASGWVTKGALYQLPPRNAVQLLNGPDAYLSELSGDDGSTCRIEDEDAQSVIAADGCRIREGDLLGLVKFAGAEATQSAQILAGAKATGEHTHAAEDGWMVTARGLARVIIARQAARDLLPSQIDIADEIAAKLRDSGVVGASGKPMSGAYIKRHALKGIASGRGSAISRRSEGK